MHIAIIVSSKDPAGINIKNKLLTTAFEEVDTEFEDVKIAKGDFTTHNVQIFTTKEETVSAELIDQKISSADFIPELIIFATKHESSSGIDSLSVHSQGNWGQAEHGGKEKHLAIAPANILRFCLLHLKNIKKERKLEYEVIQECTHHGPETSTPSVFIEIGSNQESWESEEAGNIIADTIIELINSLDSLTEFKSALGIGGPHHTPAFTKMMLREDIAFGHICPKYALKDLNEEMIKQALKRTIPEAKLAVLDWKGLGTEKERIIKILEKKGINFIKSKKTKKSPKLE